MNIGYDAKRAFTNSTGLGNYSRQLIDLMEQKEVGLFLFSPVSRPELNWSVPDSGKIISPRTVSAFWRTYRMVNRAKFLPLDLYHGLSHELPLSIKKFPCPSLVTMHDIIYKRFPQYFGWWDRQIYDQKWKWAAHASDHVVAISQSTADDLMTYFQVSAEKISVIYNCVSDVFQPEDSEVVDIPEVLPEGNFALFMGQHNERKNLDLLLRAYAKAGNELPPLVIIGPSQAVDKAGENQFSRFIQPEGNFSGEELAAILRRARMLIYPSRFEGFGLPILEAMQSGTPVISCRNSSLPEVGGDAMLYTSEEDENELIHHIQRLWKENAAYNDLREAGLARAKQFSRERHQNEMYNLYEHLTQ